MICIGIGRYYSLGDNNSSYNRLSTITLNAQMNKKKNNDTALFESRIIPIPVNINISNIYMDIDNNCSIYDTYLNRYRTVMILISVSFDYVPAFINWLIHFNLVCPNSISSLYIVCLDLFTNEYLKLIGLSCSNEDFQLKLHQVWLYRSRIASSLLKLGIDVIMIDSDAIILRNPFKILQNYPNAGIISSRATFPTRIYRIQGATLCMGFIYIKADEKSIFIWDYFVRAVTVKRSGDDQYEFNRLLYAMNLKFTTKPSFFNSTTADVGSVSCDFIKSNKLLQIVLLPHELFRRQCNDIDPSIVNQSVVVHCLSNKVGLSKIGTAKYFNLWKLNDSWNQTLIDYYEVYNKTSVPLNFQQLALVD